MVQRALEGCGIGFVRIDGKVAIKKREQAMQQLRNDAHVRVILITVSCGACGQVIIITIRIVYVKS